MKNKTVFTKTKLPDIQKVLTLIYGEKADKILVTAEKMLMSEYRNINSRGSMFVKMHLKEAILPTYACYVAMKSEGISGEEAFELIKQQLVESSQDVARFCGKFGKKKNAYKIVRRILKVTMKFMFPKQGWTIEVLEDSKQRLKLDMTSCLYLEELTRLCTPELCALFCYIDFVNFEPLAPAVVFTRENTLADGNDKCDFCFEKGTL